MTDILGAAIAIFAILGFAAVLVIAALFFAIKVVFPILDQWLLDTK